MTRHPVTANPWGALRALTPARIALGRAGVSQPTAPHLQFQMAHARARKAVGLALDTGALQQGLADLGQHAMVLQSAAESRAAYLQRPDLGRQLGPASREALARSPKGHDLAIVIADGLSATAIAQNALPFLQVLLPALEGWKLAPFSIVAQGRVAIGDEIGAMLGVQMVAVLIGERPGLSSPDSLGLYLTHGPRPGLTDEARNCISNVRTAGLGYPEAAHKLVFLMTEARRRGLSGVDLKDEAEALAGPAIRPNFLLGG